MDNIKWLFFDIGSTLADESKVYEDIFRKIAEAACVSEEYVNQKAIEFYKQNKRGDKEVARLLGVEFPEWNPKLETLYNDTIECLKILSRTYRIGIIANQIPGTEKDWKHSASEITSVSSQHRQTKELQNQTGDCLRSLLKKQGVLLRRPS